MTDRPPRAQGTLFDLPPPRLPLAEGALAHTPLAARLPASIRLGGMTWSYPGWAGHVYADALSDKQLAAHGLTAYAQHPLLRLVEIDRTYYEPLSADAFATYAAQVPDDFRFVIKAHEDCTVLRFPMHARYGKKRGLANPRYFDPEYAARMVVEPAARGLGMQLGAILFQLSPEDHGHPEAFAENVFRFLSALPAGVSYAVELRTPALLTRAYGEALAAARALHCLSVWTVMPSLLQQARLIPPAARRPLLVRWLLRKDARYEDASTRYAPFDRIVDEDLEHRAEIAGLVAKAHAHGVSSLVLVDNKAEGCAIESIVLLARELDALLTR
ncbi:MAG: DUF72 domain-containing protein [Polyangiales bacterium]